MLDHPGVGVSDVAASTRFFVAALAPPRVSVAVDIEQGLSLGNGKPAPWLAPADGPIGRMPIAFTAESGAIVDAFDQAAIAAGGKDNGASGLRPIDHPDGDGAFVIDPDGHDVEAVRHAAEA